MTTILGYIASKSILPLGLILFCAGSVSGQEVQKLKPADGAAGDEFGLSVSISGDFAIVSAHGDDDKGVDSGSAYVFRNNGGLWTEEQKLTASDGAAGDRFGAMVSISSDVAIVSAPRDDDKGIDSGSAYVFRNNGGVWIEEQKLTASDGAAGEFFGGDGGLFEGLFGAFVSISGDFAIVSAIRDDDKGVDSGSAYVFRNDGGVWTEAQKLTASDGAAGDIFGGSVSISGDFVFVGAPFSVDTDGFNGSAYVFSNNGGIWTEEQKLTASAGSPNHFFGASVSIGGDVAIIGAPEDDDLLGSAYVFSNNGGIWTEEQKLTSPEDARGHGVGLIGSISGDVVIFGGDGGDEDNGENSGAAYLYSLSSTQTLVEDGRLLPNSVVLRQNYPNPFRSSTTIEYTLPSVEHVRVDVFDVLGRRLSTIIDEVQSAGDHKIIYDVIPVSPGTYFYRLEAGTYSATKAMFILR